MRPIIIVLILIATVSCRHKTTAVTNHPTDVKQFIALFKPLTLPLMISDSFFKRKTDTTTIPAALFRQFASDSLLVSAVGKTIPRIYPIGRIGITGSGNFLLARVTAGDKKVFYILWYNNKNQLTAALPVLRSPAPLTTAQSVLIDRKYTIIRTLARKNADGTTSEGKDVYGLNPEGTAFMLIMTDALDDRLTELINPIDTLPRNNRFSGDYSAFTLSLVSIRDGLKSDRVTFFIHFERNNGECTGELKGEALIRSSTIAEYREPGDPCVLQFIFSGSSVTLREEEGCGSHRGLRCLFDGSYIKKKQIKKQPAKPAAARQR
jgi:hypothetical protein